MFGGAAEVAPPRIRARRWRCAECAPRPIDSAEGTLLKAVEAERKIEGAVNKEVEAREEIRNGTEA